MNEKICRLCLQTISGSYETIGQSLKNTLKLNMDISKDAVKCSECANNLEIFFKFKSACDYMGEETLPTDLKEDINLDRKEIEIINNLLSPTEYKHEVKCCFCTKTSRREFLTSLNESKEHKFLVDVLKEHIPKLNLKITEELLTCDACLDALQDVLGFIMKCLDVEQKINKYMEIKGMDDEGHIELKDAQLFMCEPTAKFEVESGDINELGEKWNQFQQGCAMQMVEIKSEKEIEDPELFIKTEEVDIKSEDSDFDSLQEPSAIIETDDGSLSISVFKSQRHKKCVNQHELTFESCAGKTTKRKDYLRQHILLHKSSSNVMTFKCELCPFETKYRSSITRHKLIHKSPSEITKCKCNICSHKRTSGVTIIFKCELCPFETKCRNDLNPHKLTHKGASGLMFKCELCPYGTKYRNGLTTHKLILKSSSEVTMFKCLQCPYESNRQNNLYRHILTHKRTSELTMFKRELTKRQNNLKEHKLINISSSQVMMFKCELCPYETKYRHILNQHKLAHKRSSELTMFKCELCQFETKYENSLKIHKLIH